ncbi:MAG: HD-GYP domain-containing protein [Actinomycetes bacterium]
MSAPDRPEDALLDVQAPSSEALAAQLRLYALDLKRTLADARATAEELARTHLETVAALATAVETRDSVTGGHIYRVANSGALLADVVAPELRDDPQLVYGFLLHDIGKIGVPDAVLNKPGSLDEDEWVQMRAHVTHGVRFVSGVSFLRPALSIIATHHEAVDGSGYPAGLRGTQIPLAARMFSICDAFDAMIHDRPYRVGMSVDRALSVLADAAGRQFDPDLVASFTSIVDRVVDIPLMPGLPELIAPRATASDAAVPLSSGALFDMLDEAVVLLSPEGIVSDVNASALELLDLAGPPRRDAARGARAPGAVGLRGPRGGRRGARHPRARPARPAPLGDAGGHSRTDHDLALEHAARGRSGRRPGPDAAGRGRHRAAGRARPGGARRRAAGPTAARSRGRRRGRAAPPARRGSLRVRRADRWVRPARSGHAPRRGAARRRGAAGRPT